MPHGLPHIADNLHQALSGSARRRTYPCAKGKRLRSPSSSGATSLREHARAQARERSAPQTPAAQSAITLDAAGRAAMTSPIPMVYCIIAVARWVKVASAPAPFGKAGVAPPLRAVLGGSAWSCNLPGQSPGNDTRGIPPLRHDMPAEWTARCKRRKKHSFREITAAPEPAGRKE